MPRSPRSNFLAGLFATVLVAITLFGGSPTLPSKTVPPQKKNPTGGQQSDSSPEPTPADARNTKFIDGAQPPPPSAPPMQTAVHIVKPGESLQTLARHYLPQTIYLTTAELASAIREANADKPGNFMRPGAAVTIPGVLAAPLSEQPVLVAKNFETRGIYLTGYIAGSEQGLQLIRRWREAGGNTVVFDVKDMDGLVNVPFEHRLAPR